ncbi:MAG: 50S ribosomal protein L6 [Candidatus Pacearchaeota archaeon]
MKRKIEEIIEIPEEIEVEIKDKEVNFKKEDKKISVKNLGGGEIKKEDNKIIVYNEKATKKEKKLIKSFVAHIIKAIKGLQKNYVYQLKVCFVHFPISIELKGNELVIKNFLGEKIPRKAKILEGVDVKIEKDIITVASYDKEKAGQTAANIESATRIKNRDRRVFQDGIFVIKKEKGKSK